MKRLTGGYLAPSRAFGRVFALALALALGALASTGAAADRPAVVVAFGDSLTAGYGLAPRQSFPAQLERALAEAGVAARVVNAGLSGDTTAGGRARLDWAIADRPDLVIVELGGNDALRALDPAATRANLDAILGALRQRDIPVLLTGMLAPPNLGDTYAREFNGIFPDLAEKHGVPLDPFFLEGVAARPELNQPDGIHPNAAGVARIVERLAPVVARLLAGQ